MPSPCESELLGSCPDRPLHRRSDHPHRCRSPSGRSHWSPHRIVDPIPITVGVVGSVPSRPPRSHRCHLHRCRSSSDPCLSCSSPSSIHHHRSPNCWDPARCPLHHHRLHHHRSPNCWGPSHSRLFRVADAITIESEPVGIRAVGRFIVICVPSPSLSISPEMEPLAGF